MFTLQDSNAKLVAALHEANSGAEEWKKQLAEYQEETDRLRDQVRRRSRACFLDDLTPPPHRVLPHCGVRSGI